MTVVRSGSKADTSLVSGWADSSIDPTYFAVGKSAPRFASLVPVRMLSRALDRTEQVPPSIGYTVDRVGFGSEHRVSSNSRHQVGRP